MSMEKLSTLQLTNEEEKEVLVGLATKFDLSAFPQKPKDGIPSKRCTVSIREVAGLRKRGDGRTFLNQSKVNGQNDQDGNQAYQWGVGNKWQQAPIAQPVATA